MPITITDIGHNSNASGSSVTVSVPAAGISAGSLVLVFVDEGGSTIGGSVTDTGGNTYISDISQTEGTTVSAQIFRSVITTGLTSGQTISWNKQNNTHSGAISAFYAKNDTGWPTSPLDLHVSAMGSSTSPSVASGTPSQAGELFAASAAWAAAATFTQDSGHNWVAPFDVDTAQSTASVGGGSQVNAGSSAITFSPTLSASVGWAAMLVSYKPNPPVFVGRLPFKTYLRR